MKKIVPEKITKNNLGEISVAAREMGMTYGQYMTYLACNPNTDTRKKASYSQSEWKTEPEGNSLKCN